MAMEDLVNKFLDPLRFVPYIKQDKVKIERFLSCLPHSYKEIIEFDNPKSLNEVFRKARMCYEQYKHRFEIPKAWKDKKQDKMNQSKKGFQLAPFCNMENGFQRKDYHTNTHHTKGGHKTINLGFKKVGASPREPLKCWECGEPHLQRNCPFLNLSGKTAVHYLQESSTVGDIDRSMHTINATKDGMQEDHQSIIVEVEGKIHDNNISILIDPGASLSYITLALVESNRIKKVKHAKSWLVQLATGTKRKVT
jgi:hypothetical protein